MLTEHVDICSTYISVVEFVLISSGKFCWIIYINIKWKQTPFWFSENSAANLWQENATNAATFEIMRTMGEKIFIPS